MWSVDDGVGVSAGGEGLDVGVSAEMVWCECVRRRAERGL